MNIGIDIRPLMSKTRTGVGEYTYELLNAVFALDKTNQYFLFYNSHEDVSGYLPQWRLDNIKYLASRWPNKLFNSFLMLSGFPKLDKMLKQKIDVFYSPNLNFTAVSRGCKFMLTAHDLSFRLFPEFFTGKQRLWHRAVRPQKQCRRADIIITPSVNTKRDIMDYYGIGPEKIKVIYPGLSLGKTPADVKTKYTLPDKYFLFLGTVEPRKNITGLIDAFEKAYSQISEPYFLVIAGAEGWKSKSIYERAAKSPLKDKIKIIGYIEPVEKYSLYENAVIFIYPSFYEGFGFPVLEAMSAGVPVVTSNRSSLPEVGENAVYYINPNNPLSIAEALVRLAREEKLRLMFKDRGLQQAQKFSWTKAAQEWLNLVNQL